MEKQLLDHKTEVAYKRTQELADRDKIKGLGKVIKYEKEVMNFLEKEIEEERQEDEYQAEQTQRSDEQELENARRI